MKRILLGLVLLTAVIAGAAEESPTPSMPSEITLTSGRVLRKVEVVRWEKDRVVVRHVGGVEPIPFVVIAEPMRARVAAFRREMEKPMSERRAVRTITGQVFVTTVGAGAYKFSNVTVFAYPQSLFENLRAAQQSMIGSATKRKSGISRVLDEAEAWQKVIAGVTPIGFATTDGDGKFSLKLFTKDAVFLYCISNRMAAGDAELNLWVVPFVRDEENLSDRNTWP